MIELKHIYKNINIAINNSSMLDDIDLSFVFSLFTKFDFFSYFNCFDNLVFFNQVFKSQFI